MGLFGLILSLSPAVLALDESLGLSTLFSLRGSVAPAPQVAVVGISEAAAAALGQTNELDTWPRDLHATLIDRLQAAGAAVIVFDLAFIDARDPVLDAELAAAIERAGNVALLERTESRVVALGEAAAGELEWRTLPLPAFKGAALASAPFVLPEVPVSVWQFWTYSRGSADVPSLPTVAVQAFLLPYLDAFKALVEHAEPGAAAAWPAAAEVREQHDLEAMVRSVRADFRRLPLLAQAVERELDDGRLWSAEERRALRVLLDLYRGAASRYLNYYGPARTLSTISYDDVIEGRAADVAGKIVFVGVAETHQPEQQDDFYSVFSQQTGINVSGVEIAATAAANLLEQKAVRPIPMAWHLLLVALLGGAVAFSMGGSSTRRAAVVLAVVSSLYLAAAYFLFAHEGLWLPLLVPLFVQWPLAFAAVLWWNYRELLAQRERVHKALGYYVPSEIAHRLAEQSIALSVDRQLLHGTCLYTDAERYTSVSEKLRPTELAALMNDYYGEIFGVVERRGGQVSDTAGDSMVAVWASADPAAVDRESAVRAALEILTAVEAFNRRHPGRTLPTRIGLESGEMLLGNIGAEQRYEYRAVGDIVNTAARIQALNVDLGTRLLVSADALPDAPDLPTRDVGTFLVRGKGVPVHVFEPIAALGATLDAHLLDAFGAALRVFREGAWEEANRRFEVLATRCPKDGPTLYYRALCANYLKRPPADWRGVVRLA